MYVHFHLILFAFAFIISNTPYQKRWRLVHQPIILQILIKTQRKSSKNFKPSINNVDSKGTNFTKKNWLSMCLLAVLGSQGTVVKYTTAMLIRTVDYSFNSYYVTLFEQIFCLFFLDTWVNNTSLCSL